jgi:hydrogenase expression/formation protein HypC
MCLAIPGRIIEKYDYEARVEVLGITKDINLMLLPDARVGEWVLVHAGFAIARTDPEEAEKILEVIKEVGQNS